MSIILANSQELLEYKIPNKYYHATYQLVWQETQGATFLKNKHVHGRKKTLTQINYIMTKEIDM